jgi:hypothetical protein
MEYDCYILKRTSKLPFSVICEQNLDDLYEMYLLKLK